MKSKQVLRLLLSNRFDYEIVRQRGSHRTLRSPRFPRIIYSYHDDKELSSGELRTLFCNTIGLTLNQALEVLR